MIKNNSIKQNILKISAILCGVACASAPVFMATSIAKDVDNQQRIQTFDLNAGCESKVNGVNVWSLGPDGGCGEILGTEIAFESIEEAKAYLGIVDDCEEKLNSNQEQVTAEKKDTTKEKEEKPEVKPAEKPAVEKPEEKITPETPEVEPPVVEEPVVENPVPEVPAPSGNNTELRAQIVEYAMQFLGNPYVHGGSSLTTGTDCSGFTCLIYKDFGYSIDRTPAGQLSGAGRSISIDEIQPGDIVCYGSSKCTHVALYIGNGQIIHEANSKKGVVIYEVGYDNILGIKNVID